MAAQLTSTVPCPLAGFEAVSVTYNMLASEAQADDLARRLGGNGTAAPVVVAVEGWDAAAYGADPWDRQHSPMAFRAWAARVGYGQAVARFVHDPNSWTASTHSTLPTPTAGG